MKKIPGKKIRNLRAFGLNDLKTRGNRVKPVNDFIEFKEEEIHQSIGSRFEEQVRKYPGKVAVKTETQTLTYDSLNQWANRVAHTVLGKSINESSPMAALLFGQNAGMIVGIMGALKAGKIYVPLDSTYPAERLTYMLKDSGAGLIITDTDNIGLALELREMADRSLPIIDINKIETSVSAENPGLYFDPAHLAYILYTSGSSGTPKGVIQNHRNVLHFARVYTNALHIHPGDRLTLFSSYSFDAAKMDIYGALLNGAALYPFDIKQNLSCLVQWLEEEEITIYHSIPTVYRYFIDELLHVIGHEGATGGRFLHLRFIVLGGEAVFKKDVEAYKRYLPDNCLFINGLGPTESTVTLQFFIDKETQMNREAVPVGYPVDRTDVLLIDDTGREVPVYGVGEIVYKSDCLALGYLNKPDHSHQVFVNPLAGQGDRVFHTGDLGRRLPDGNIEYSGRKDSQVKVSGFRIEPGEIESRLDKIEGVKKSAVVCQEDDKGENYLAAFYMKQEEWVIDETNLVRRLKKSLPDYMIPRIFLEIKEFPLTPTGKIDRKNLSRQDTAHLLPEKKYVAPGNEIEVTLAEIWRGVLGLQDIVGIDDNFFVLGGNSLRAVLLTARIHKALKVKIPLEEIFKLPTIRELSKYIEASARSNYEDIKPVEKRDYYPLSSAQRRLFFLDRYEEVDASFNMSIGLRIRGKFGKQRYEWIMKNIIRRHQVLRTSFHLIGGQPVQRVHDVVDFRMEHGEWSTPSYPLPLISQFIRPFDLSMAPLLRVGVFSRSEDEHYLLFDAHHIIFDGTSLGVMANDFIRLYQEKECEPLKIQYKDFALWQNHLFVSGKIKEAESYWLNLYPDAVDREIPRLKLPLDFPRPDILSYKGDRYNFTFGKEETLALKEMALQEDVSLFMLLLAIYNVFLSKITRQEDVIVATIISGRNHTDVENVIGVFVNMLALRNFPVGKKSFEDFLREVKDSTLKAFENRDYPFETLVEKLPGSRNIGHHPLMDVGFTLQNADMDLDMPDKTGETELRFVSLKSERKTTRKDLNLEGFEAGDCLYFEFQYCTELFKEETVERFAGYLKEVVSAVIKDHRRKIKDIDILPEEEKNKIYSEIEKAQENIDAEFDI